MEQTVFIADDDQDDRESIRDAFLESKHEHDFRFFKDGDTLLDHLRTAGNGFPSLILLDLNMPGKDGRDVLRELKNDSGFRAIPVVILTTSSLERDREATYSLGANCFITKPNSYRELVSLTDAVARLWLGRQQ